MKQNDWITQGIKILYKHIRSLNTIMKNNNDPKAKEHYMKLVESLKML